MLRSSAQGVDPPVCRVLDVAVTYARDSFVDSPAGPFVFSGGGNRQAGIGLTTATRQNKSFWKTVQQKYLFSRMYIVLLPKL